MSNISSNIESFAKLGDFLISQDKSLTDTISKAGIANPWFTEENIKKSIDAIAKNYLSKEKLTRWVEGYKIGVGNKNIGLVLAGNIPLVGFHDLLSALITNNNAIIKLSSKDNVLPPFLLNKLVEMDNSFKGRFEIVDKLSGYDAVIATGSDNSARYFEYYFGKKPNIIRKNRTSVAILDGNESKEELQQLGEDMFSYFGLGCRNVSKIFVPKGYDFKQLFEALDSFKSLADFSKYRNNYDYNLALLLLNKEKFLQNEFMILKESDKQAPPISVIYYEEYTNMSGIKIDKYSTQCIVSKSNIPFGKAQHPELSDYADNIDAMDFLTSL